MTDWMTDQTAIYVILLIAGIAMMALAAWLLETQRVHEWSRVARHLGLQFSEVENNPLVRGEVAGRSVELRVAGKSSDAGAGVAVVQAAVAVLGVPPMMQAEAIQGLLGQLSHLAEDRFFTGYETFDQKVHLQGETPQTLRRYWTEQRREAFLKLMELARYDRLWIEQGRLLVELRQAGARHQQLENLLKEMLLTAQELDSREMMES